MKYLREEFNRMDLNSDERLTKEELFLYLDKKVKIR